MARALTQEEKDKRTIIGLTFSIFLIIVAIILVSYNYDKNMQEEIKENDPTIIEQKPGTRIKEITYPSDILTVSYLSHGFNTNTLKNETMLNSAIKLLEIAEKSFLEKDIKNAKTAVNNLENVKEKEKLLNRINNIELTIKIEKELEIFKSIINNSSTKSEIDKIKKDYYSNSVIIKFNKINESNKKKAIKNVKTKIEKILNDTNNPIINYPINNGKYNNDVMVDATDENEFIIILKNLTTGNEQEIKNNETITEEGKYELKVIDEAKNESIISFIIDKTSPTYRNEQDKVISLNSGSEFLVNELLLKDNIDGDISTTNILNIKDINNNIIDKSNINTNIEGTYIVTFVATDSTGNEAFLPVTVNILPINKDKYLGEYKTCIGNNLLTLTIKKENDNFIYNLPNSVILGTDTLLWNELTSNNINNETLNLSGINFTFNETNGTLTALNDGKYAINSAETDLTSSIVFNVGTIFTKNTNLSCN